jgi:hypothetical protein
MKKVKVGKKVKIKVAFFGFPQGTVGKIVKIEEEGEKWKVAVQCDVQRKHPFVDWFTQEDYEKHLEELR